MVRYIHVRQIIFWDINNLQLQLNTNNKVTTQNRLCPESANLHQGVYTKQTVLRECKPPPRRLTSTESDIGFEYEFPY